MIRGATDLGANAAAGAAAQSDATKAATREVFDRLIVYLAGHECENMSGGTYCNDAGNTTRRAAPAESDSILDDGQTSLATAVHFFLHPSDNHGAVMSTVGKR